MKRVLLTGAVFALSMVATVQTVWASLRQAGALSLRISTGTRPAGMGDAFVGLADDYSAMHFNPAGLGRYPMNPDWLTYPLPKGLGPVRQIALLRNNVPDMNYQRYDVWVLAGNNLLRMDWGQSKGPEFDRGKNLDKSGLRNAIMLERALIRRTGPAYDTTRIRSLFEEYRQAGKEERIVADSLRNVNFYLSWAGDSSKPLDTTGVNRILANLKASILVRWSNGPWSSGIFHDVQGSETLEGIVARWVRGGTEGVSPERLAELVRKVAEVNNRFTYPELVGLKENVLAALPPDFVDSEKEKLAEAFDRLLERFDKALVVPSALVSLNTSSNRALEDQKISVEEASEILTTCRKATANAMLDQLFLPYNLAFEDSIVAIAGDERVLWVATQSEVFRFDGESWNSYGSEQGLPEGAFRYLAVSPARTVWLANPKALISLSGGRWTISEAEGGFPEGGFKKMVFAGERDGWAISDKDLYHYDGKQWSNRYEVTAGVSPELEKLISRFVPGLDSVQLTAAVAEVRQTNNLGDSVIATGQKIYLPYRLAFPAPLTALAVDPAKVLWAGTEAGVWRFAEGEFTRFGHQFFMVTKEKTVLEVARKFTRDSNPQRLARWIERIKKYNRLETDDVFPGQKLWLYTGPAGSRITTIHAGSDVVWLGTEFGVLKFNQKEFERYEPAGLARMPTVDAHFKGADGFFATAEQVTVYARPWRLMGLMHSKWLPELAEDLFFDVPAYLQHFSGVGTFGLQVTFLSLGRNTRIGEAGDTLGYFDSFEGSIGLTYGTRLSQSLSGGITGKFILSKLASSGAGREIGKGQGTSFALALGLLYDTPIKKLTFGAALTNIGPKLQFIDASQADPLPRNLAIGFSYKIIESAYNKLTLLADINRDLVSRDTTINPFKSVFNESIENFGLEYWYGSYFAGRMGYVYDPDGQLKYMTLGTSLQYRNFRFDLAYIPSSKNLALANTLRLALVGRF